MQAHPAGARRPVRSGAVAAQTATSATLPAVGRTEQGGVFDPGVDRIRIGERWLEMPDALELPWGRCRRTIGAW